MEIRPIRSEADHLAALEEIERLWGAPLGTPKGDKLDVLATLVAAYEADHHPIPAGDPVDVLQAAIEDLGQSLQDLAMLVGSATRASEILNRQLPLTLEQIQVISSAWHLPIALLAAPYRLEKSAA